MFEKLLKFGILGLSVFGWVGCGEARKSPPEIKGQIEIGTIPAEEPDLCVLLTEAQRKAVQVGLAPASMAPLVKELELPGEIGPDPEKLLHVAARFSGVARSAGRNIGEAVRTGDTLAVIESNENLSLYSIIAGRDGTIIDKHVVPGEFVEAGRDLFVIADLSRVVVTIAIFGSDAEIAVRGASARIMSLTGNRSATGVIDYVSPFHNEETRSLSGRVPLSNAGGAWKPGALVRVRVQHREPTPRLLVPSEAVQLIDGAPHVFIPETDLEFEAVPVTLGRKGATQTEILKGLAEGDTLVTVGAFELKAQLAIQAMGEGSACSH